MTFENDRCPFDVGQSLRRHRGVGGQRVCTNDWGGGGDLLKRASFDCVAS